MTRRWTLTPSDVALVETARRHFAKSAHKVGIEELPRFPDASDVAGLSRSSFVDLMDRCVVDGFRDKRWPILSERARRLLQIERTARGISDFAWKTVLQRRGVADIRELDGDDYLTLLGWIEELGADLETLILYRRDITTRQVRLIHTMRRKVEMEDARFYRVLATYGGVHSTADLDARGCTLVLAHLRLRDFDAAPAAPAVVLDESFGRRPGFASPEQLGLIRALWLEYSGADDEAALCAWLERSHGVSALRFMTGAAAGKAITALKAMKRRRGGRHGDTAA